MIFAAAAVMVAVFFTFALSGPLPPKEMGVILGIAVLLDAALIRLVLVPVALRLLGRARLVAAAVDRPRAARRAVRPRVVSEALIRARPGCNSVPGCCMIVAAARAHGPDPRRGRPGQTSPSV